MYCLGLTVEDLEFWARDAVVWGLGFRAENLVWYLGLIRICSSVLRARVSRCFLEILKP